MTSKLGGIPELCAGDRLTRDEFERRYEAMPHCKKAELVEGVVYIGPPVRQSHGGPNAWLAAWLGNYRARTPGVDAGCHSTVRLDLENEVQPDVLMFILTEHGGTSRLGVEGYVEGPPELAVEVTGSSSSYDLHDKLRAYQRNGLQEYLVLRVDDAAVDWFALRAGRYERLQADSEGVLRSGVFPGLWLDVPALLRNDLVAVMARLDTGCASPEHDAFADRLRR